MAWFLGGIIVGILLVVGVSMSWVSSQRRKDARRQADKIRAQILTAEASGRLVPEFQRFRLRIALMQGPMSAADNEELAVWLERLEANGVDIQAQIKQPIVPKPVPSQSWPSKRLH